MSNAPKLFIELVPRSTWHNNYRNDVGRTKWDAIKAKVAAAASHRCEICGGAGSKWPVECHEVWEYDDDNCVQKLIRLQALCPDCHQVKHAGLAAVNDKLSQVVAHLMKVNGWSNNQAQRHIMDAFTLHTQRSAYRWTVEWDSFVEEETEHETAA